MPSKEQNSSAFRREQFDEGTEMSRRGGGFGGGYGSPRGARVRDNEYFDVHRPLPPLDLGEEDDEEPKPPACEFDPRTNGISLISWTDDG